MFLIEELRKKLLYTLGVIAVYRAGVHVPLPGINLAVLKEIMSAPFSGSFFYYMDLFSGGALKSMGIMALGMGPYINASIAMQLLTVSLPSLEALAKEGEYGRQIINQYTRYLAWALSLIHGFGMAVVLENSYPDLVLNPGLSFKLTTMFILSMGSLFLMWLGEQINYHGMGNGSSVIIFAGIVSGLPAASLKLFEMMVSPEQTGLIFALFVAVAALLATSCIVFLERGERRVAVQYTRRMYGQKMLAASSSYIPFKLNSAGVIPVIFASTIMTVPVMIFKTFFAKFGFVNTIADWFDYSSALNNVITFILIIFFSYFYTFAMTFNPVELAENIRKSGGFILGIRPGKKTADFFEYVLIRIGLPGSLYLATLALLPRVLQSFLHSPVWFDGVSLLIAVGVALDLSAQIESLLIQQKYDGFLSVGRLKGRYSR